MRVIARRVLVDYYAKHPETKAPLERWYDIVRRATWESMNDVQAAFPKAKVLNHERVRFEIAGGNYRLIAAFKFGSQIAFVKFVGTHKEYDGVDAFTVSQF